jgi:hypothetical protein
MEGNPMRYGLSVLALILSVQTAAATEVTVPGGGSVAVPGTGLTVGLTAVTDQRCPSAADCYWEGLIRVELAVTDGDGAAEAVVLCNRCEGAVREARVAGHQVTLVRLEPGREVLDPLGREVVLGDYRVVLEVTGE